MIVSKQFRKITQVYFMKRSIGWLLFLFTGMAISLDAQKITPKEEVYKDKNGILRWRGSNKELQGFGVNYTAPFAYGYKSAKQLGVNIKAAIDADFYHFARLGFDAYRVHVWDTEISDTVGNLLDNEHLELFDYTIMKMKQRGMRFLITPIAYWGNGWPEPDTKSPGFSYKYGKDKALTDTGAIKAQQRYLFEFLNHVNRFTGIAYKDEPAIVAFEISNEPHHGEAPSKVTAFIKGMIASMRRTGCTKPVFYNISHKINLEQAYFDAGIDGGTFQWYPTGLLFKQELKGNMLPNVDEYHIPFKDMEGFKKIAKVVYEFDAADIGRSYIYPAMARSFRTAGIQWATHFAWDPTYSAYANTEYDTHFMNLVYAPQKALSLMIAGEVFHRVPLYKKYGNYPADTSFDGFRVSYVNDLAELVTTEKFIYTNNTNTKANASQLKQLAGSGSSAIVDYSGTGAYFLDKIKEGVWRLEVMPDAFWINDPFGRNSLKKTNAVIGWNCNHMKIALPSLGDAFTIKGINAGNNYNAVATGGSFLISPGTYILAAGGLNENIILPDSLNHLMVKEFNAPTSTVHKTYVLHQPVKSVNSGDELNIDAVIVSPKFPSSVELYVTNGFRTRPITMLAGKQFHYSAKVPIEMLKEGFLKYYIVVKQGDTSTTFPSGNNTNPKDWDFYDNESYTTLVINPSAPLELFNAFTDAGSLMRKWLRTSSVIPGGRTGTALLNINVEKLYEEDNENPAAEKIADYSMKYYFGDQVRGRRTSLNSYKQVVVRGNSLNGSPCKIQLALLDKDGVAYGNILEMDTVHGEYRLPIAQLEQVKSVLLPRPYPSFLPYYFNPGLKKFDINGIESLQISIGPGLTPARQQLPNGIAIESVVLE
jgi:hypothetical protein